MLAALIALGLLTGLLAGVTGQQAAAGTTDLGNRAQPLLAEAETIYANLADADTTAAQAFLAGGLEPAALTERYNDDLTRATTALTEAARLTPEGSAAAGSVQAISTGLARYTALVATARADNRQGLPVGSSYLSSASELNRTALLPEAKNLFDLAQREVRDGYTGAAGGWWSGFFALLLVALLGALWLAQRYLSRHTHRTFNVPLLAATVLTLILGLGTATVLLTQNQHLDRAADTGSTPVVQLAEARILALQERGDEALTLAMHGSSDEPEKRWQAANPQLKAALNNSYLPSSTPGSYQEYAAAHEQIRKLDGQDGNYDGAVELAIGTDTTGKFEQVTADLTKALDERKIAFTAEIDKAGRGLTALAILGPLAALAICALAFAGIRTRLEEYR
ncbi:hypothetical protein Ate02nite_52340 [Paractinoplanes tereljensis]|uniref:Secreted protein n=2 Tax=Paractinoplanes tereljensis TaxID=571912 RepID=A0A919TUP3_9ACTN|nr:hypothetical protein Ate02nite_52340 [Actinoplanes tereljensis]